MGSLCVSNWITQIHNDDSHQKYNHNLITGSLEKCVGQFTYCRFCSNVDLPTPPTHKVSDFIDTGTNFYEEKKRIYYNNDASCQIQLHIHYYLQDVFFLNSRVARIICILSNNRYSSISSTYLLNSMYFTLVPVCYTQTATEFHTQVKKIPKVFYSCSSRLHSSKAGITLTCKEYSKCPLFSFQYTILEINRNYTHLWSIFLVFFTLVPVRSTRAKPVLHTLVKGIPKIFYCRSSMLHSRKTWISHTCERIFQMSFTLIPVRSTQAKPEFHTLVKGIPLLLKNLLISEPHKNKEVLHYKYEKWLGTGVSWRSMQKILMYQPSSLAIFFESSFHFIRCIIKRLNFLCCFGPE